jgi:hypothetical protein
MSSEQALDWPTYWFAALERAVEASDFQAAAEAQKQLERLGVKVQFVSRPRKGKADAVLLGDGRSGGQPNRRQ